MTDAGIQLALLDGMDEGILIRLHESGIRTRDELGARLATPEARRELALRLGVPAFRIEAIHHLNYLLPEERVARFMDAERRVLERVEELRRGQRILRRLVAGLAVAVALLVLLLVAVIAGPGSREALPAIDPVELRAEVDALRRKVESLQPLAREQADAELHDALSRLGPAPGWRGPIAWDPARHRALEAVLGTEAETAPKRALSIALAELAVIENAPPESLDVVARAERAAGVLAAFPPPGPPATLWDAGAVSVRLRLTARALGRAPLEDVDLRSYAVVPGEWTAPGMLRAELLLARLEALPVREDALAAWSETVLQIRASADAARDALGDRPEALAREYWVRRAELEFAVAAAVLGRGHLLPYAGESPAQFLAVRRSYLNRAFDGAPAAASGPLAWLLLEYEEARRLVRRLAEDPAGAGDVEGRAWLDAMVRLEERLPVASAAERAEMLPALERALAASGVVGGGDPWRASRTAWEAALRPLLIETRRAGRSPATTAERDGGADSSR